jgi:putative cell wall-binding protein
VTPTRRGAAAAVAAALLLSLVALVAPSAGADGGGPPTGYAAATNHTTTTTTTPGVTATPMAAGSTVSTDPANTLPTPSNLLVSSVRIPVAGSTGIGKVAAASITGVRVLASVSITAPDGTVAAPLRMTFVQDVTDFAAGMPLGSVIVFRDGAEVANCQGVNATPDPCVLSRSRAGNDITVTALSTRASTWSTGRRQVQRIFGDDRFASAIAISRATYADRAAGAVVLSRSDQFADALAGAPLAAAKGGPLLLTGSSALNDATLIEITRVLDPGKTVYLLGGVRALSAAIETRLVQWGFKPVRIFGDNRYETAVAVAVQGLGSPGAVVETTGTSFADALAAGAVAAKIGGAVLLTNGRTQAPATASYLATRRPVRYALGGPAAAADPGATAFNGADRYETAVLAARRFFPSPTVAGLASGVSFPDALAGSAQIAASGGPLLLAPASGTLPVSVQIYLRELQSSPPAMFLYGGTQAVNDEMAALFRLGLGG